MGYDGQVPFHKYFSYLLSACAFATSVSFDIWLNRLRSKLEIDWPRNLAT